MTHPNLQTNGASLEDCHTNFFALTELSGIKWRKLVWCEGGGSGGPPGGGGNGTEPLDDPVLRSYARCLAADILCVWRRVSAPRHADIFDMGPAAPAQPPPLSLTAAKELWIFWYGEEPDLADLVAQELTTSDCEQGSWESGLSYECRSLLFKALHNLIERCLLSRGFVRLGKWFVQPHDGPKKISESASSSHLSFSFAFFVHGESSVCASVDVRQHPAVRKLNRSHLQQAQTSTSGLQVILAPFGLAGVLTGQSYKSPDATARLLDDWGQFYPLDKGVLSNSDSVVEVIVSGVKLRYPSCYVLVTDMDDNEPNNGPPTTNTNAPTNVKTATGSTTPQTSDTVQTPPPSPVQINSRVPQPGPYSVSVEHPSSMQRDPSVATVLPERVWQECLMGGPPVVGGQQQQQQQQSGGRSTPGSAEMSGQWEFVDPTKRSACTCSKCPGSYTPQGGPPSYPRTQESTAIPSVGSPPSVAPSPLPNPHSQQPASVPPGDQTMPTLSPHPPTVSCSPADKTHTPEQPPHSAGSVPANSPLHMMLDVRNGDGGGGGGTQMQVGSSGGGGGTVPVLKRPVLSSKEYETALEEEEQTLDMLYDYSTLEAWLNHPVKRFKPDSKEYQRNKRLVKNEDLYTVFTHNGVTNPNADPSSCNAALKQQQQQQLPYIKQEIKQEPDAEPPTLQTNLPHGIKRPGDPYEFDEEGGNACRMDGFKRGPGGVVIKDETKEGCTKKSVSGNLFTSEGLQPSLSDLDQIFDNSDDTSSEDALQVQTPPGSNKSMGHHDDTTSKRLSGHGTSNMGILRPEELSKMFPTPPSLEHNPIASPCGQLELPPPDVTDLGSVVRVRQEIYPNMGSPQEENIEDWSFVFKPPSVCKMVGSSKYAPLTNLPSQNLPPVTLPTHCVYKPSWMQHVVEKTNISHVQQQQQQTQPLPLQQPPMIANLNHPIPSVNLHPTAVTSMSSSSNPFPPSPMHATSFRPPPPPYELPSPATSTASSYLNKNLNSVEAVATPLVHRTPEASSLILNVLLADTAFNIFRDHNFDSCTLCVCNVVGNIRGADAGIYVSSGERGQHHAGGGQRSTSPFAGMGLTGQPPPPYGGMLSPQLHVQTPVLEEDSVRCSCGFSAVVNRRLSHKSGLFYEDEMEITGVAEDPGDRKKSSLVSFLLTTNSIKPERDLERDQIDTLPHGVLELVREQCLMIQNTANALCRAARFLHRHLDDTNRHSNTINVLEYSDSNDVISLALEQSRQMDGGGMGVCKMDDGGRKMRPQSAAVHRWPFLRASGPQCNQDIVRVMKVLQPLLQEAIQKKCQTRLWEAPSAVKGPLTWRQFHRLAGRGTDDRCEPQPIPSVMVGHEKDWLSLSPYALQHWESLLLEPYSYPRDVAYVVVAPDSDVILPRVKTFFKELSTAYEMCRLGRHSPITKVLRDGILRVGKRAKAKLANEPMEEWFALLGEGETTNMLKLYAQACKHHLAPHLQQVPMDKTLLDPPELTDRPTPSPMPPPSTPDNSQSSISADKAPSTPKSEDETTKDAPSASTVTAVETMCHDDDDREAPSVVVYLVEPFTMGSDQPELQRLASIALLRCYQSVLTALPENIRSNVRVQIISQESIVELNKARDRNRHSDHMRALALSIFSQCRRLLVHSSNVKSLTGFGTAAMADQFLKSKDEKNRAAYKLYTPPYVLAPLKDKVESVESFGRGGSEHVSVLYLSYCLSEDQSWLLAVATDERGEIFETVTINIDIPNRSRRKKASARRIGLQKLMDFILGVMSQSVRPWRLVVGRLGRIGHGELKGWSWLLSRKNLLKTSKHLKEICSQCSLLYPNLVPCILSACLVSLEADSALRLMPDQFTPDERFSQVSVNSQLSTPQDVTCTHILVFPTSATTQSSQTAFQEQQHDPDLGDEDIFNALNDDMPDGIDGMNDFSDIFNWSDAGPGGVQSPGASPRREESGPGCGASGGPRGSPCAINTRGNETAEEVGTLLQQPLALGYMVSTAPTGTMPGWFWASCPHLEGVCPAFLKNALHLHSPNIQQSSEDLLQQSAVTSHPLDSQYTTDVLRYVLEGYNALSWLALDSNTKDRLSCLPVHMQVLVQLYHTTAALL